MGPRFLVSSAAVIVAALAPAAAGQGFLVEFGFDTLWFKFHPAGLASTQTTGSGLEVSAVNVKIEGDEVMDLRHCIDGWGEPDCSYGNLLSSFYRANQDGVVDETEVANFEKIAVVGAGQIEKIKRMSETLQNNVTVDGVAGGAPRVVELDFRSATGPVDSASAAFADVKSEVGYANDKAAKRHEIHVHGFHLDREGFQYATARWTLEGDKKWAFKADETLPPESKAKVGASGWTSTQSEFESSTDGTLRLVVDMNSAKKKSPGFEVVLVGAALGLALVAAARRRSR